MSEKIARRYVLDAQAVMVWLNREPAANRVEEILYQDEPWMTLVNLGEVTYVIERTAGRDAADTVHKNLLSVHPPGGRPPIQWVPIDEALVRHAASLKASGGMSYADCFVAAAAARLQCPVLTGDREFTAAERVGIAVEWL